MQKPIDSPRLVSYCFVAAFSILTLGSYFIPSDLNIFRLSNSANFTAAIDQSSKSLAVQSAPGSTIGHFFAANCDGSGTQSLPIIVGDI